VSLVTVVAVALTAVAAMTRAADAQPARVPLIGVLSPHPSSIGPSMPHVRAFKDALRELGWTPGQNVRLEVRYSEGRHDRLELLLLRADQVIP
jgi:hypothetical protein